jgi:hypothetical protein
VSDRGITGVNVGMREDDGASDGTEEKFNEAVDMGGWRREKMPHRSLDTLKAPPQIVISSNLLRISSKIKLRFESLSLNVVPGSKSRAKEHARVRE